MRLIQIPRGLVLLTQASRRRSPQRLRPGRWPTPALGRGLRRDRKAAEGLVSSYGKVETTASDAV
jgi:hypothetical protein